MSSIQFFFENTPILKIKKNHIKKYIKLLLDKELYDLGDISVIFCSDEYLLDVNVKYLQHNYYTDIVTFNYVEDSVISGDLFISVDRVRDNAETFDAKFVVELYRVIFHGVLHLVGYNDKTDQEKVQMREKENFYIGEVDFGGIEL